VDYFTIFCCGYPVFIGTTDYRELHALNIGRFMVCLALDSSNSFLTGLIGFILILYVAYSLKTGYFHRKPSFTSFSEWGQLFVVVHKDDEPGYYWSGIAMTILFIFVLLYVVTFC